MKRTIQCLFIVSALAFAPHAYAQWSPPAQSPTGGNTSAPINVGATTQTKGGVINVNGIRSYVDGIFDGKVGVGSTSPFYKLDVSGSVGATAYFYISDRRLKSEVKTLDSALENIIKLRGVSFNWKEGGKKSMGLIAQEVEEVYPQLVSLNTHTGMKSVEYANLVAPLIEAVKEQQRQIEVLRAEIESLKAKR